MEKCGCVTKGSGIRAVIKAYGKMACFDLQCQGQVVNSEIIRGGVLLSTCGRSQ